MGQSLRELGLETKLVPQEKSLYLISHASLEKRGLSQGAAMHTRCFTSRGTGWFFPSRSRAFSARLMAEAFR